MGCRLSKFSKNQRQTVQWTFEISSGFFHSDFEKHKFCLHNFFLFQIYWGIILWNWVFYVKCKVNHFVWIGGWLNWSFEETPREEGLHTKIFVVCPISLYKTIHWSHALVRCGLQNSHAPPSAKNLDASTLGVPKSKFTRKSCLRPTLQGVQKEYVVFIQLFAECDVTYYTLIYWSILNIINL